MKQGDDRQRRKDAAVDLQRGFRVSSKTEAGFVDHSLALAERISVCKPIIVGGWHRRHNGRAQFRMQSARGLLRTIPDERSGRAPRRFSASLTTTKPRVRPRSRRRPVPAVVEYSAPGEETDSRSRGPSMVHSGTQTTGQVESGGLARRCRCEGATAARSPRGERQPHPPFVDVARVEWLPVPGHHLVVLLVDRIERRLEELHEAEDAADVLRRAPPLAVDERRVVSTSASPSRTDSMKMSCLQSSPKS